MDDRRIKATKYLANNLPAYEGWTPKEVESNLRDVISSGDVERKSKAFKAMRDIGIYGNDYSDADIDSELKDVFLSNVKDDIAKESANIWESSKDSNIQQRTIDQTQKVANTVAPQSEQQQPTAINQTTPDVYSIADEVSKKYGVDPNLVKGIIKQESNGNPNAVSNKGAKGAMQLLDSTAQDYGVTDTNDPRQNIEGGVKHLKRLLDKYQGDTTKALQAYNFGEGNVDSGKSLPAETLDYVPKVMKNRDQFAGLSPFADSANVDPTNNPIKSELQNRIDSVKTTGEQPLVAEVKQQALQGLQNKIAENKQSMAVNAIGDMVNQNVAQQQSDALDQQRNTQRKQYYDAKEILQNIAETTKRPDYKTNPNAKQYHEDLKAELKGLPEEVVNQAEADLRKERIDNWRKQNGLGQSETAQVKNNQTGEVKTYAKGENPTLERPDLGQTIEANSPDQVDNSPESIAARKDVEQRQTNNILASQPSMGNSADTESKRQNLERFVNTANQTIEGALAGPKNIAEGMKRAVGGGVQATKKGQFFEGVGNAILGIGSAMLATFPEVAQWTSAAGAMTPTAEAIGENIGGEKGQEIARDLIHYGTTLPFGLKVLIGSAAQKGGEEGVQYLLDNSEWAKDNIPSVSRKHLAEAAGQVMFFGALGIAHGAEKGIKSGFEEYTKVKDYSPEELKNLAQKYVETKQNLQTSPDFREKQREHFDSFNQRANDLGYKTVDEFLQKNIDNNNLNSEGRNLIYNYTDFMEQAKKLNLAEKLYQEYVKSGDIGTASVSKLDYKANTPSWVKSFFGEMPQEEIVSVAKPIVGSEQASTQPKLEGPKEPNVENPSKNAEPPVSVKPETVINDVKHSTDADSLIKRLDELDSIEQEKGELSKKELQEYADISDQLNKLEKNKGQNNEQVQGQGNQTKEVTPSNESIIEPTPEVKSPVVSNKSEAQSIIDKYEEGNDKIATVSDVADKIESIDDGRYSDAISEYRKQQEDDRSLSGRGDMDTADQNFLDAIRRIDNEQKQTEKPIVVDKNDPILSLPDFLKTKGLTEKSVMKLPREKRVELSNEFRNLVEEKLLSGSKENKEQSRLETERINKQFEEQLQSDELSQSIEDRIDAKINDKRPLTDEEQKYFEENQHSPKGFKYDSQGNLVKLKQEKPIEQEPLSQKKIDNAEPLTTAKIEEAAKAAPKAGNTLKEQKNTLLSELEKAQKIAEPHPNDIAQGVLKENGFTLDEKGRIITEIPGDGTFYTPIKYLSTAIENIKKRFPTSEELSGSEIAHINQVKRGDATAPIKNEPKLSPTSEKTSNKKFNPVYESVPKTDYKIITDQKTKAQNIIFKGDLPSSIKKVDIPKNIPKEAVDNYFNEAGTNAKKLGYAINDEDIGYQAVSKNPVIDDTGIPASAIFLSDGKYYEYQQQYLNLVEGAIKNPSFKIADNTHALQVFENGKLKVVVMPIKQKIIWENGFSSIGLNADKMVERFGESFTNVLSEEKPLVTKFQEYSPSVENKTTGEKAEIPITEKSPSFDTYKESLGKLKKNEYNAEGLKKDFQYFVDNKEAIIKSIRDWLDTSDKYKRKRSDTKDKIAKDSYDTIIEKFAYAGNDGLTYSPFGKDFATAKFEAIKNQVENTTDEMIAEQKKKSQVEEQRWEDYKGRAKQAIENPQTLEDFQLRKQFKVPELTPDQQARYEDLYSIAQKKKHIEKNTVDVTSVGEHEIKQDKDTRDNSDLWVVKPKQRLGTDAFSEYAKAMRQLGGYWSRFKGGFLFKEDPSAKLGGTEKVEFKQKIHSDRLRETADNMQETIEKKLDTEGTRLENTARRARMGDGQRADGEYMKRIQQTMKNIADGLDGGDVALLDKISARTEIEQLDSILGSAKQRRWREEGKTSRTDYENTPIDEKTVSYAEYPKITLHKSDALKLIDTLGSTSITGKQIRTRVKEAKDEYSVDITDIYQKVINAYERVNPTDYMKEALENSAKNLRRLEKLGIESPEELRAYLREYLKFRKSSEGRTEADNIRTKERELLGRKIDGYFPTPKSLVENMLEKADIQDGMSVTEPSAGKGNIADAIREEYPNVKLSVIEQYSILRDILNLKKHNLVGNDFLKSTEKQDRFVMNPPFENMQDVDHVRHAYDLLNDGGKVVAIMSESTFFRSDKKATEFRDWLESVNGESEKNPEGSFKTSERPTGVATRTVVIEKPKADITEQTTVVDQEIVKHGMSPRYGDGSVKDISKLQKPVLAKDVLDNNDNYAEIVAQRKGIVDHVKENQTIRDRIKRNISFRKALLLADEISKIFYPDGSRSLSANLAKRKLAKENLPYALQGLGITHDFQEQGGTKIVGKTINSSLDVAAVTQILRNPYFEILRIIFVKNGKVFDTIAVSSRIPNASAYHFPNFTDQETDEWVKKYIADNGVDAVWLQHNHSSGESSPSPEDIRFTHKYFDKLGAVLKGHVIINGNEYSVINKNGYETLPYNFGEDKILKSSIPHQVIGEIANNSAAFARIGKILQKDNYLSLIGLTSRGKIVAVADIPNTLIDNEDGLKKVLKSFAERWGLSAITITGLPESNNNDPLWDSLQQKGYIHDAVAIDGRTRLSEWISNDYWFGTDTSVGSNIKNNYVKDTNTLYNPLSSKESIGKDTLIVRSPNNLTSPKFYSKDKLKNKTFLNDPETRKEFLHKAQKKYQDYLLDLKKLQEEVEKELGHELPDEQNPYRKEELSYSKEELRLKDFRDNYVKSIVDDMKKLSKEGIAPDDVRNYLMAKHAPERNAYLRELHKDIIAKLNQDLLNEGNPFKAAKIQNRLDEYDMGSGISDSDAKDMLDDLDNRRITQQIEPVANKFYDIAKFDLKNRVDSGLLSQETKDEYDSRYQYYIPMRGFEESDDDKTIARTGRGSDIRGSEYKTAQGRRSKAGDVLSYTIQQAEEGIIRSEKNEIDKALFNFVNENPSSNYRVKRPYFVAQLDTETKQPIYDVNTGLQVYRMDYGYPSRHEKSAGLVEYSYNPQTMELDERDMKALQSDNIVAVKIAGKTRYMEFDNVELARAIKKMNIAQLGTLTKISKAVISPIRSFITQYSIYFAIRNFRRDAFDGVMNLNVKLGVGSSAEVMKNIFPSLGGLWRYDNHNHTGYWTVMSRRFYASGAPTGYKEMLDIDSRTKALIKEIDQAGGIHPFLMAKHSLQKLADFLNEINRVIENGVRLSSFEYGVRKMGWSDDKAASFSKNLTVNFNRKGEFGTVMNSIWMFSNANIQGNYRQLENVLDKKTRSNTLVQWGIIFGLSVAMAELVRLLMGKDDDGTDIYDKINSWELQHNIVFPSFNPDDKTLYYKLTDLPYGAGSLLWSLGVTANQLHSGTITYGDAALTTAMNFIDAFSPFGAKQSKSPLVGTLKTLSPTAFTPAVELGFNENFAGQNIKPDDNPFALYPKPESEKYFKSVNPLLKKASSFLNEETGGDKFHSGAVSISPEIPEYLMKFYTGGVGKFLLDIFNSVDQALDKEQKFEWGKIPIANVFTGKILPYYDQKKFQENTGKFKADQDQINDLMKQPSPDIKEIENIYSKYGGEENFKNIGEAYKDIKTIVHQDQTFQKKLDEYNDPNTPLEPETKKSLQKMIDVNKEHENTLFKAFNKKFVLAKDLMNN